MALAIQLEFSMRDKDFWLTKNPQEMSNDEWESLCDGCGKCCTIKYTVKEANRAANDPGTGDRIIHTNVACTFLNCETATCSVYETRFEKYPNCVDLTPDNIATNSSWLPSSCGYKLVFQGKDLPDWHPLKTGNPNSTLETNNSMAGQLVNRNQIEDLDDLDLRMDIQT
jgi:uncharacterized cysteine cluster protein YcgN (CxxCxxCC family)